VVLALGNSIGMLVLGAVLLVLVGRRAGYAAFAGLARASAAGLLAGAVAAAAGVVALRLGWHAVTPDVATGVLQGMLSGVVVGVVFLGVLAAVDRRSVRPLTTATRALGRRRPGQADLTGGVQR